MSTDQKQTPKGFARWRGDRRALSQRRAEMPIIDAARAPMSSLKRKWPGRAVFIYLWLRIVRPLAVTLFWLLVVRYAWSHLFGVPDDLPVAQQIALYSVAVLVILLVMLALAPLRRREVQREPTGNTAPAPLEDISEFTNVGPDQLADWQQAQRLVVHHDDDGLLDHADPKAPVPVRRARR